MKVLQEYNLLTVSDMEQVRGLLSVEGTRDDPGPSGLTGFALSIGMLVKTSENKNIIVEK